MEFVNFDFLINTLIVFFSGYDQSVDRYIQGVDVDDTFQQLLSWNLLEGWGGKFVMDLSVKYLDNLLYQTIHREGTFMVVCRSLKNGSFSQVILSFWVFLEQSDNDMPRAHYQSKAQGGWKEVLQKFQKGEMIIS